MLALKEKKKEKKGSDKFGPRDFTSTSTSILEKFSLKKNLCLLVSIT